MPEQPIHGRGASGNPANRFDRLHYEPDQDAPSDEASAPATQFFKDSTKSIIASNDSPDVGFQASINPYRGCEHGCVYCYARPYHEYLGFSAGLDFETRILVKEAAPLLLRQELSSPKWEPQVSGGISGVTDCYQPVERRLKLTRQCLEVLAHFRIPRCHYHQESFGDPRLGPLGRGLAPPPGGGCFRIRHHSGSRPSAANGAAHLPLPPDAWPHSAN